MAEISFETLGSCPVPGATPAGDDARYEPEYAAVLEEIDKLSFSGQAEPVSWSAVEKNAVLILAEKAKDLQMAAYLGVALWQNRGLAGLVDGIHVLAGFLENFWETGWPAVKRMRGRVNAIDWWHERTYGFLQDTADRIPPLSAEQQKELLDQITRLDELVSSLIPDASPMRDLMAAAKRLPVVQEEQKEVEIQESEARTLPQDSPLSPSPLSSPSTPSSSPSPSPPPTPSSSPPQPPDQARSAPSLPESEDPAVLRRHFAAAGLAYIALARRTRPADAALWQLSRLIVWGGIFAAPASEDGQTLLPAPDKGVLAQGQQKLQAGDALGAAVIAEELFLTAPFCLDAQKTVYEALSCLGGQFSDAADRVAEESARFFTRLPGLDKLSFIDGTPFAAPETITWLQATVSGGTKETAPPATGDDPFASVFASARELAARRKLGEALGLLDAARTDSPSANLRLRTCQLRLLREGGKKEAAQALAEALLLEVSERDLDNWDPPLALEALTAIHNALSLEGSSNEQQLRDVCRRIARLSPAALG